MRINITIFDLRPLDNIPMSGPPDEEGFPTVTAEDYEKARKQTDAGERGYFGRIEFFPRGDKPVDLKDGVCYGYDLPAGLMAREEAVEHMIRQLTKQLLASGLIKDERTTK
jgi:hypothetical protein